MQMNAAARPPVHVLHVEDNPGDVRLVAELLRESAPEVRLSVARDGAEALRFLRREGPYRAAVRPDLVLLDLKLPRKTGLEVLQEAKQDAELQAIPMLVLTSSAARPDVEQAYTLHANCYLIKPIDFEQFARTAWVLSEFWFHTVRLPAAREEEFKE